MAFIRLPRFTRAGQVRPIRLTERDFEIIRQVNRHRFLRSSHICRLLDGSPRQILRRLQLLYHHGYLERPRAQLDYFHRSGSEPIVYGLGNKGAELLIREHADTARVLNWGWKNQSVGRVFLDHAILTSDIVVGIESGCRATNRRLLHAEEIAPPGASRRNPFQWKVTLAGGKRIGVIPDAVFAIEPEGSTDSADRSYFFLEADCGTMPVKRASLVQTSFFRKLLAYQATWRQDLHRADLGLPRFRVLTVTTSAERLQTMVRACQQLPSGHGLFLFAQASALGESDPLNLCWTSGREKSAGESLLSGHAA